METRVPFARQDEHWLRQCLSVREDEPLSTDVCKLYTRVKAMRDRLGQIEDVGPTLLIVIALLGEMIEQRKLAAMRKEAGSSLGKSAETKAEAVKEPEPEPEPASVPCQQSVTEFVPKK